MSRLFGGVIQNGYVVRNIEAAMRHWIDVLGVGPWFYIDHLPVADFQYKGQPSPVDISLALANSGTLQIELIQQRNDAPSLYRDFLQAGHEGLQHLGYGTREFETDLVRLLAMANDKGECRWDAELYRLKGEILLVRSAEHHTEAEACFCQALDIARRQQAKSWELRAAMSLARLRQCQGKHAEAHELLAPIYAWFTEGFDTADLQEARALLEALAG